MKEKDLDFILNVLQEKPTGVSGIDWYSVMGFLELNRVTVPFFNRALKLGIALPPQTARKCANVSAYQKARNREMGGWAQKLGKEMEAQGIAHAFLKGTVMAGCFFEKAERPVAKSREYPDASAYTPPVAERIYADGERASNDIDLLIAQKDISKAGSILTDMGFMQGYWDFGRDDFIPLSRTEILSRRMNRGETAPYLLKLEGDFLSFIEVDINFSLDHLPGGENTARFLRDVKKYDHSLRGLDETRFFLHLLLHQYKESTVYSMVKRGKDTELYKYLDIYLFIHKKIVDFEKLEKLCRELQTEKAAYFVLSHAAGVFDGLKEHMKLTAFLERIAPDDRGCLSEVYDPENGNKKYYATKPLRERLAVFGDARYLPDESPEAYNSPYQPL